VSNWTRRGWIIPTLPTPWDPYQSLPTWFIAGRRRAAITNSAAVDRVRSSASRFSANKTHRWYGRESTRAWYLPLHENRAYPVAGFWLLPSGPGTTHRLPRSSPTHAQRVVPFHDFETQTTLGGNMKVCQLKYPFAFILGDALIHEMSVYATWRDCYTHACTRPGYFLNQSERDPHLCGRFHEICFQLI